jgi:hypothetical protein
MNTQTYSNQKQHLPSELNDVILDIVKSSPGLHTSIIQLLYRIAAIAFAAGVNAGMYAAIDRIEKTNSKLQELVN